MRILQVSSFMPPHQGGLELVANNLFNGIRERNHEVRWIASATPLSPGIEGDLIRVSAFKSFEELLHVPLPFWGISGYQDLYSLCKWSDIIHVHDCIYPSSAMAILFARRLRKPSVVTQHIANVPYGWALSLAQKISYHTLGRLVMNSVTAITTVSAHIPPYFQKLGFRKPIKLIRMGFEDRFNANIQGMKNELRRKYDINADGPVLIFAGRLVPKKGVAEVVAVQQKLAQRGCTLIVAGDGAMAPLLKTAPRTIHFPYVPYSEMHEIYGLADVLFLPSHGEGFPLTLQEALLCGLPAVVSEDPSYLANVSDAPGVFICESEDSYLKSIGDALTCDTSPCEIAQWARLHFSQSRFLDEYEALYRRLYKANMNH